MCLNFVLYKLLKHVLIFADRAIKADGLLTKIRKKGLQAGEKVGNGRLRAEGKRKIIGVGDHSLVITDVRSA